MGEMSEAATRLTPRQRRTIVWTVRIIGAPFAAIALYYVATYLLLGGEVLGMAWRWSALSDSDRVWATLMYSAIPLVASALTWWVSKGQRRVWRYGQVLLVLVIWGLGVAHGNAHPGDVLSMLRHW